MSPSRRSGRVLAPRRNRMVASGDVERPRGLAIPMRRSGRGIGEPDGGRRPDPKRARVPPRDPVRITPGASHGREGGAA
jgi:hypothetical protein